ncbi:hypothetical protein TNCV_3352531 [Trichonephila clavipes]|nr:hypothetical protein TNCV_3352531 [Trichonephila clavipes]
MALSDSLPQINLGVQGGAQGGYQQTDHVILIHGQVTWMTPELASPLLTTTPHLGRTFKLSKDLTCIAALHGGSLVVLGSNS